MQQEHRTWTRVAKLWVNQEEEINIQASNLVCFFFLISTQLSFPIIAILYKKVLYISYFPCGCFVCMYVCILDACLVSMEARRGHLDGCETTVWMTSIKLEASGRASTLDCEAALLLQLFLFASVSIMSSYFLSIW